jgi:phosphoenolpyruvate carboxylase
MVMTPDKIEELGQRFQAIHEALKSIDSLKDQQKTFAAHIRETIKTLAEANDLKQKAIKEALKNYIHSIEEPEEASETDEIFALLKEHNLLKLEVK